MPRRNLKLRAELVQLIEKQIKTLAKQSCDHLTVAELREYQERRKRIDELYDALHALESAA